MAGRLAERQAGADSEGVSVGGAEMTHGAGATPSPIVERARSDGDGDGDAHETRSVQKDAEAEESATKPRSGRAVRAVACGSALLAMSLGGCAAHGEAVRAEPIALELLAWTTLPPEPEDAPGRVGELSGLAYREESGTWLAVSDGALPEKVVELAVELRLEPVPALRVRFVRAIGMEHPAQDAEAIAIAPDGSWIIGYEMPPTVARFAHGEHGGFMTLPTPQEIVWHARENRGFESVAWRETKDGPEIWAATESALTIDGDEATRERGALCRVVVFDGRTHEVLRQYFYKTEPSPRGLLGLGGFNSLAEMHALPDGRILTLERSLAAPRLYDATIFLIDGSSDAQKEDGALPVLRKRRIASLRELGLTNVGNFEGMALGPTIDDDRGGRLLLLVADDNAGRDGQVGSQFAALRILE
ncbi:MAG: esterase-like activity of phytase family protein [Phycisphaeraceae bacterium]|nr:MAG: esterase-like activity of phytase family protein [Phycisphaeraceae bacterium]